MFLSEVAKIVDGELVGEDVSIERVSDWENARENDLVFIFNSKDIETVEKTVKAKAFVIPKDGYSTRPHVKVDNPRLAMAKLLKIFDWRTYPQGIHPTVILGENVKLGKDVAIGAYVSIGNNVTIGNGTKIFPGVIIGNNVEIGENCVIYPRVTIYDLCFIGDNVLIHSGTSIGVEGLGYIWDGKEHVKMPQIGKVVIEDNVEIMGNSVIERGTLGETRIGKGTKLGSLVEIGHNVTIGESCIVVGQSGIAGSSKLGNNVVMAGQTGVADHVKVGNNVVILARGVVTKDIPDNVVVSGFPAMSHTEEMKIQALIRKLPEIWEEIKKLRKKLE
ncbi:MAG TPA: UDP-3-O-(3-hydroxymyristoyl)glucosamine N-acyltransferase [Dictyoglomaceae bacterium]|nr:UDP-3-O-(3-hydroxymyristoyl)glucosamine N-acyltransferase [Dictyoglomaceae bacterium]